ncbi:MAG TPA: hypothetical protein VMY37_26550 [Thermoguttaceae bacterium]|nr:hypothetical protein [Thermoguttaceae bacterium]
MREAPRAREDKIVQVVGVFNNAWKIGQLDDFTTLSNLFIEPYREGCLVSEARRSADTLPVVSTPAKSCGVEFYTQNTTQLFDKLGRTHFDAGTRRLAIPLEVWLDAPSLVYIR